jgi:hypothetical protein
MKQITLGRVLLAGLVAGLFLNIGEFLLNEVIFGKQMEAILRRMNVAPPEGRFVAVAVGLTFVSGIVLVFLYALIRPRLGPGPKTAIVSGVILWFGAYFYAGIIDGMLYSFPVNFLVIALAWGLVEYCVSAIVGAWLYTEA